MVRGVYLTINNKKMKVKYKGEFIDFMKCEFCVFTDRNDQDIYNTDKIKVFTDCIGENYNIQREIIVCEIIWEDGGFHAVNIQTEEQFPLWQIRREGVEKITINN